MSNCLDCAFCISSMFDLEFYCCLYDCIILGSELDIYADNCERFKLKLERGRNAPLTEINAESVQIKEEFT